MIRVLQVNDKLSMDGSNPSSVAHLLGGWLPILREEGIACEVCTFRDPDPGADYLEARSLSVRRFGHGKLSPLNLAAIVRTARASEADLLHLHGFAAANFGRLAARALGVTNVVHEHAALLDVPGYQRLADRLLRGWTDAAIAVSENVREFMVETRSIPPERIEVLPNGVDLRRFRPVGPEDVEAVRAEMGIRDGDAVVGTVTRLRREKGTEWFLRSAPLILRRHPDAVFLVAGDGPLRDPLMSLTRELGVEDRVRFLGFRTDVPRLLGLLDVLVIPSLTEGFPLSALEGMAAGCPIVATRVGGLLEVARDGENVLLVPARDAEALASRTLELLERPDLANRLSEAAGRTVREYSVARAAERLADFYHRLLARAHADGRPEPDGTRTR